MGFNSGFKVLKSIKYQYVPETKKSYKRKTMEPTSAHICITIGLYTQWIPTYFCQTRGHNREYKIQCLKLKIITKV